MSLRTKTASGLSLARLRASLTATSEYPGPVCSAEMMGQLSNCAASSASQVKHSLVPGEASENWVNRIPGLIAQMLPTAAGKFMIP